MRTLLAGLVCVVALATPAFAQTADPKPTMSMSGTAEISVSPDQATVTTGVTSQAETAREALTANNEAMAALIDVLKQAGIDDKDIQTSGFSVQPQYVYSDARDENGYNRPPEIASYQVSNNVTIIVRDLESLGPTLDQVVSAGSNTISGISFGLTDKSDVLDQARRQAFANAKAKAELYATEAGVELGNIVSITEQGGGNQPPVPYAAMRMDAAESVPVQAGQVGYSMTVSVSWELLQ